MNILNSALEALHPALPFLAMLVVVVLGLFLARRILDKRFEGTKESAFRIQLTMLGLTLAGLLAVITSMPISDTLRGQLLSLVGIVLSASIALASTTFLGNAMAGVLIRVVGGFKIGDFVRVGDHFGRVSERGLFHTEIQTEDSDLTTLPNSYLISNPVTVVRAEGTIISAEVSLGYDVPREHIEKILLRAAERAGLREPFVYVIDLGDFSVTYRTAGLLDEVKRIISARSLLRSAVLDELHASDIEIVSPTFMNTRALNGDIRFIPRASGHRAQNVPADTKTPESIVFDKADQAEELEALREQHSALEAEIKTTELAFRAATGDPESQALNRHLTAAQARLDQLAETIAEREVE